MTSEQFTYWLQGFMEISGAKKLSEKQVQIINDHLALVFNKQTPDRNLGIEMPTSGTVDFSKIPNNFTDEDSINRPLCNVVEPHVGRRRGSGSATVYC